MFSKYGSLNQASAEQLKGDLAFTLQMLHRK